MRRRLLVLVPVVLCAAGLGLAAPAIAADPLPVFGSGSTWAADAMTNWAGTLQQKGVRVGYSATGSTQGRHDFAASSTDFAVTDLTWAQTGERRPARVPTYVPTLAGAVGFPYDVRVDGVRKRNVRLSGATLADIFSGHVVNWNDNEITADNNGAQVAPDLAITPVVRSDGAATSYHLTDWFSSRFPEHWRSFSDVGATAFFPRAPDAVAVVGSANVAGRVADANGAIGYDETGYDRVAGNPEVAVGNVAGYFVAPTAGDVGLALLAVGAPLSGRPDFGPVYAAADPRAYPLSYFAVGVVPVGDPSLSTGKAQGLIDLFGYALCQGQQSATMLGYATLPVNLTRAGLGALRGLPADASGLDLARCANPALAHRANGTVRDALGPSVPQPMPCAKEGAGPC